MNGFEVVPGSERAYVLDENGNDAGERHVRPSREVRDEELERERRRLQPIIQKGQEAQERLAWEEWRRLRDGPGVLREFAAEDDPEASPIDNAMFAAYRAWRDG